MCEKRREIASILQAVEKANEPTVRFEEGNFQALKGQRALNSV